MATAQDPRTVTVSHVLLRDPSGVIYKRCEKAVLRKAYALAYTTDLTGKYSIDYDFPFKDQHTVRVNIP